LRRTSVLYVYRSTETTQTLTRGSRSFGSRASSGVSRSASTAKYRRRSRRHFSTRWGRDDDYGGLAGDEASPSALGDVHAGHDRLAGAGLVGE
jgi:hypothetical protein